MRPSRNEKLLSLVPDRHSGRRQTSWSRAEQRYRMSVVATRGLGRVSTVDVPAARSPTLGAGQSSVCRVQATAERPVRVRCGMGASTPAATTRDRSSVRSPRSRNDGASSTRCPSSCGQSSMTCRPRIEPPSLRPCAHPVRRRSTAIRCGRCGGRRQLLAARGATVPFRALLVAA